MVEIESCVLFSTADWNAPYWTNKQHTAALLAKRGTKVLYIESIGLRMPNLSNLKDFSRLSKRLVTGLRTLLMGPRYVQTNVWVLSPLVIPFKHDQAAVRWFNQILLNYQVTFFLMKRKLKNPLIWTYHPFMLELMKRSPRPKLVYHCVDDLAAVPGVNAITFKNAELKLLSQADVVFATAPALAEYCIKHNSNTHFFGNVVDEKHFGKALDIELKIPPDLKSIPRPRICYHGILSDYKIDFELLADIVRMKPEWSFVIIGEEREGQKSAKVQEIANLTNVHFLGYRDYKVLPDYLRGIQVGLLPSLINNYTNGMFPMKCYEYLAAGVPVVSTNLSFSKNGISGILTADNSMAFIKAIDKQLLRGRFNRDETIQLVADNTWDARLSKMLKII